MNKPLPPQVQHIWGPFLIVTPASTLHNWQQECSRFMPELSVLPYWGSPHERKTIRKFWSQVGRTNTLLPSLTLYFTPHNPSHSLPLPPPLSIVALCYRSCCRGARPPSTSSSPATSLWSLTPNTFSVSSGST